MNADAGADALSCSACRIVLPEYAAGSCAAEVHVQVSAHLHRCAACRAEAQLWSAISSAVRQPQPGDEPPPGSLTRALTRVLSHHDGRSTALPERSTGVVGERARRSVQDAQVTRDAQAERRDEGRPRELAYAPAVARSPRRTLSALTSIAAVLLVVLLASVLLARGPGGEKTRGPVDAGATWLTSADLRGLNLRAVVQVSPGDVWAVGGTVPDQRYDPLTAQKSYVSPVLLHCVHGRWYRAQAQADLLDEMSAKRFNSVRLEDLSMLSSADGWAVGTTLLPPNADGFVSSYLLHLRDGTWHVETELENTFVT